jgi:HSP20 family protein
MAKAEKVSKLPARQEVEGRLLARDPFREMDRIFDRLIAHPFAGRWMRPWNEWTLGFEEEMYVPRVDVIDRENEVVIRAEVPGVGKDDLDVSMTDDSLTFRGSVAHEERKEEEDYVVQETRRGAFSRTIPVPAYVDQSKVKARYHDGIVELTLPKTERSKRRKIEIER